MSEAAAVSTGAPSAASSQSSATPASSSPSQSSTPTNNTPQAGAPTPQASQGSQATPQAAAAARKLGGADLDAIVELKVNGQVKEMPLREALKIRQLEDASQAKMQEAAKKSRQADYLLQLYKSDPDQFAKIAGVDLDSFAEERLAKKYELSQMSPEQKRIHELESRETERVKLDLQSKQSIIEQIQELTGEKVDEDTAKRVPKERMVQYLQDQQQKFQGQQTALEQEFLGAWKQTGLPNDPMMGQWMAAEMFNHQKRLNAGKIEGGPLQAAEAAAKVKGRFEKSVRSMCTQMDAPAIHEFLGKDIVQKIIAHKVAEVNRANDPLGANQNSPAPSAASEPKKALNEIEWRKAMGLS